MPTSFQRSEIIRVIQEDYSSDHWSFVSSSRNVQGSAINLDLIRSYEDEVIGPLMSAFANADGRSMTFGQIVQETNESIKSWAQSKSGTRAELKRVLLPEGAEFDASSRSTTLNARRNFREKIASRIFQAVAYENRRLFPEGFMLSDSMIGTVNDREDEPMPKVFLSYQYEDRLYTIGLFYAFLRVGLFLYVDWMHNGKIHDTNKLKEMLLKEVVESDHFASLPSIKAAFDLNNDRNETTSWCAWEVGVRRRTATGRNDNKALICVTDAGNYDGIFKTFDEAHSVEDALRCFGRSSNLGP